MSAHMRLKRTMRSAVRQHRLAKKLRRQAKLEPFGRPRTDAQFRAPEEELDRFFPRIHLHP